MKRTGAGTEGETGVGSGCGQRPVVSLERVEEVQGGGERGRERGRQVQRVPSEAVSKDPDQSPNSETKGWLRVLL